MKNPQSEAWRDQAAKRNRLAAIEQMLDTVNLRNLTPDFLSQLEADLSHIIEGLHNVPIEDIGESVTSRKAVMTNLIRARRYLIVALNELRGQKAIPERFYKSLRACQESLENALDNW